MEIKAITNLRIGDKIEYHFGCLAIDRKKDRQLDQLANYLWDVSGAPFGSGEFALTQDKEGYNVYRYFAKRVKYLGG